MIEDENNELLVKEAAGFKIHRVPEVQSDHAEKSKLDLGQVEQDLFNFFEKINDKIPEWVPIVSSYLKAKKEQWVASAALRKKDLTTGQKIENTPEALKLFLERTLKGLWQEGLTALDVLMIFSTGGAGNVALGVERVAAKEATGAAGKLTMEGLMAQLNKLKNGGEGAVFDGLPGLFKGLGKKLEKHPEQASHLFELANIFEKIQKIPGARPIMEQFLAKQEWWQEFKKQLQSGEFRQAQAERVLNSATKAGFTFAPKPA